MSGGPLPALSPTDSVCADSLPPAGHTKLAVDAVSGVVMDLEKMSSWDLSLCFVCGCGSHVL